MDWDVSWLGVVLMGICVVLVILPTSHDPAILWKEWNIKRSKELEKRRGK